MRSYPPRIPDPEYHNLSILAQLLKWMLPYEVMDNPRVVCICLTADRHRQTDRVVRSFLAQTYSNRYLLVLDTGKQEYQCGFVDQRLVDPRIAICRTAGMRPTETIGNLRNFANELSPAADIIAHFDSDDYSAPTRIEEQVRFLQSSGADVVGYSDMLFWRRTFEESYDETPEGQRYAIPAEGEAWLHNNGQPNYALGTSLMYWRRTWESKPFPDKNAGCDDRDWVRGLNVKSVPSIDWGSADDAPGEPMMVAEIHGGNTCARITEESSDWTRVPHWDEKLRIIMEGK